jgi:hypothetical protein
MIRQCAWCRQVLGKIAPLEDESVTHGLCAECHAHLLESRDKAPLQAAPADLAPALLSVEASE